MPNETNRFQHIIDVQVRGIRNLDALDRAYDNLQRKVSKATAGDFTKTTQQIDRLANSLQKILAPDAQTKKFAKNLDAMANDAQKTTRQLSALRKEADKFAAMKGLNPALRSDVKGLVNDLDAVREAVTKATGAIRTQSALDISGGRNSNAISKRVAGNIQATRELIRNSQGDIVRNAAGQAVTRDRLSFGGNTLTASNALQQKVFDVTLAMQRMFGQIKSGADISGQKLDELRGKMAELLRELTSGGAAGRGPAFAQANPQAIRNLEALADELDTIRVKLRQTEDEAIKNNSGNFDQTLARVRQGVQQQANPLNRVQDIQGKIQGLGAINQSNVGQAIKLVDSLIGTLKSTVGADSQATQAAISYRKELQNTARDAVAAASAIDKKRQAALQDARAAQVVANAQTVQKQRQPFFAQQQKEEQAKATAIFNIKKRLAVQDATTAAALQKEQERQQREAQRQADRIAAQQQREQERRAQQQVKQSQRIAAQQAQAQKDANRVSFLPERGAGTSKILNQVSAAAGGLLLGLNALQGGILGVAFGLIFMKFNLVGTQLAVAALTISIGGLIVALSAAIRNFSSLEPAIEALRNLSGSSQEAGAEFEFAAQKALKFGFGIDDSAAAMLNLRKAFLANEDTFQTITELAAGTGTTMAEASQTFATAVGLQSGSLETLQSVGIKVTKQQADQFNQMDRLTRLTVASELINNQFAGAAERRNQTLAGSWTRLTQAAKYFFTTIGGPIVKLILVPLFNALANLFNKLTDGAQAFLKSANGMKILGEISKTVSKILEELGLSGEKTSDTFRNRVATAIAFFFRVVLLVLQGILKFIQLIKGLINALRALAQYLKPVIDLLRRFAGVLKDLNFGAIFRTFKEFAFDVPSIARAIAEGFLRALPRSLFEGIIKGASDFIRDLANTFRDFEEGDNIGNKIARFLENLRLKFKNFFQDSEGLFGEERSPFNKFLDFVRSIPDRIKEIPEKIRSFVNDFTERIKELPDRIKEIPERVGKFFDDLAEKIRHPGEVFESIKGFADRIRGSIEESLSKVRDSSGDILDFIFKPRGDLKFLREGISEDAAKAIEEGLAGAVEKAAGKGILGHIFEGLKAGILFIIADVLGHALIDALPVRETVKSWMHDLFEGALWGALILEPVTIVAGIVGAALERALKDVLPAKLSSGLTGAFVGGSIGGLIGSPGGPLGIAIGVAIGAAVGFAIDYVATNTDWSKLFDGLKNGKFDLSIAGADISVAIASFIAAIQDGFKSLHVDFSELLPIGDLTENLKGFAQTVQDAFDTLEPTISSVSATIKELVDISVLQWKIFAEAVMVAVGLIDLALGGNLSTIVGRALALLASISVFMDTEFVRVIVDSIRIVGGILETLAGLFEATVGTILALIQGDWAGAWSHLSDGVQTAIDGLGNIFGGLVDLLLGPLEDFKSNVLPKFVELGKEVVQGFKDGVVDAAKDLLTPDWLEGIFGAVGGFLGKAKDILGVFSPSKETYDIAVNVMQGFIDGIDAKKADAVQKAADAFTQVLGAISGASGINQENVDKLGNLDFHPVVEAISLLNEQVSKITDDLNSDAIKNFSELLTNTSTAINNGLEALGKINDFIAPTKSAVQSFVQSAGEMLDEFTKLATNPVLDDTGSDISAGLITMGANFASSASTIFGSIGDAADSIKKVQDLGSGINVDFNSFALYIIAAIDTFKRLAQSEWGTTAIDFAKGFFTKANELITDIKNSSDAISGISTHADNIGKSFQHFSDAIGGSVLLLGFALAAITNGQGILNNIKNIMSSMASLQFSEVGEDIIYGIAAGMLSGNASGALANAASIIIDRIIRYIRNAADSHSPAGVTKPIGSDLIDGISEGMTNRVNAASSVANDVVSSLVGNITSQTDQARAAGQAMGEAVANGFSGKFSEVTKKSIKLDDLLPAPNPRVSSFFNLNDRVLRKIISLGIDQKSYQEKDPSAFVKTAVDYLNIFKTVTENFGISAKAYTLSFDDLRKVAQDMGDDLVVVGGNIVSLSHTIESFSPIQRTMLDGLQQLGDVTKQQAVTIIASGAAIAGMITDGLISLDQFIANFQNHTAQTTDPASGQNHPQTSEEFFFSLPQEARERLARLLEELHRQGRLAAGGVVMRATRALIGEGHIPEGVVPLAGRGAALVARALGPQIAQNMTPSMMPQSRESSGDTYIINVPIENTVIGDDRSKKLLGDVVADAIVQQIQRRGVSYR